MRVKNKEEKRKSGVHQYFAKMPIILCKINKEILF